MNSMFDVVLSLIIGGMLVLSMITAMTTIHAQGFNQQIHITLMRNSEDIGKIIRGYYLANLGIKHSGNPIISVTSKSFRFWSYIINPVAGGYVDTDVTIAERTAPSGEKTILVYRNNNPSLRLFGPFVLDSSGLTIRYYDRNDSLLTGSFTASDIYSVEMGFRTQREGINLASNNPLSITNYVYLKKYLINRYH